VNRQGKLIIITAPSGAGKTTIGRYLLEQLPQLKFSVSATTRAPREGEKEGVDYYFMSEDAFGEHIRQNDFLEWEEVYPGRRYGTLRSEAVRLWNEGKHVIFDIDVLGAMKLQAQFPANTLSVFIAPPSLEELKQRLMRRKTESPENVAIRLKRAEMEMSYMHRFDAVVVNDDLETAKREALQIVSRFLNSGSD